MSAHPHVEFPRAPGTDDHPRRLGVLRALLAFSIVSTLLHFTHNFVRVEDYPPASFVSNQAVQVAIVVFWPLFTALALYGHRLYRERRYRSAHRALAIYAVLPLTTLGHFTTGNPDIPLFWYSTIFTDGLAGVLLLAFVMWSAGRTQPARG